jgi:hypothetical protein
MFNFLFETLTPQRGGMIRELPAETNLYIGQYLGKNKAERAKAFSKLSKLDRTSNEFWKSTEYRNGETAFYMFMRSFSKQNVPPWNMLCSFVTGLEDDELVIMFSKILEAVDGGPKLSDFDVKSSLLCLLKSSRTKFVRMLFSYFPKGGPIYESQWENAIIELLFSKRYNDIDLLYRTFKESLEKFLEYIYIDREMYRNWVMDLDTVRYLNERKDVGIFFKNLLASYVYVTRETITPEQLKELFQMQVPLDSVWKKDDLPFSLVRSFIELKPDIVHLKNSSGNTKLDHLLKRLFYNLDFSNDALVKLIMYLLSLEVEPNKRTLCDIALSLDLENVDSYLKALSQEQAVVLSELLVDLRDFLIFYDEDSYNILDALVDLVSKLTTGPRSLL